MDAIIAILIIGFLVGMVVVIIKTAKHAYEKYEMRMIRSWTFPMILIGPFLAFWGFVLIAQSSHANGVVTMLFGFGMLGGGTMLNIRKSNVQFGLWFSFLQLVAGIGIIAPIIILMSKWQTRKALDGALN